MMEKEQFSAEMTISKELADLEEQLFDERDPTKMWKGKKFTTSGYERIQKFEEKGRINNPVNARYNLPYNSDDLSTYIQTDRLFASFRKQIALFKEKKELYGTGTLDIYTEDQLQENPSLLQKQKVDNPIPIAFSIIGYANDLPPDTSQWKSNQELALARATAMKAYLIQILDPTGNEALDKYIYTEGVVLNKSAAKSVGIAYDKVPGVEFTYVTGVPARVLERVSRKRIGVTTYKVESENGEEVLINDELKIKVYYDKKHKVYYYKENDNKVYYLNEFGAPHPNQGKVFLPNETAVSGSEE